MLGIGAQNPDEIVWLEECEGFYPVIMVVE